MPRVRAVACARCGHLSLHRDRWCDRCGRAAREARLGRAIHAMRIAVLFGAIAFGVLRMTGLAAG